jgi:hypothetical protein
MLIIILIVLLLWINHYAVTDSPRMKTCTSVYNSIYKWEFYSLQYGHLSIDIDL